MMIKYDNSNVRRQERLLDEQSALRMIRNGEFGVLSMIESDNGKQGAYGIPVSYVWDEDKYLYFHCAPAGHKLKCIDSFPMVSFTIVGQTNVISHKFTTAYESVIIRGQLTRGLPLAERMHALILLLDKYSPNDKETGLKYAEKSFHRTEILKLEIESISGKTKRITP